MARGGFTYTPKRTRDAESEIAFQAKQEWVGDPLSGAVSIIATFNVRIPKSWPKKKKERLRGRFCVQKRGDLDNYVKLLADALNGIIWEDDSQIVEIFAAKVWSDEGSILLKVQEVDNFDE